MDMTQIGVFMALAETLSFSKTAALLYVSQPYVSKQIAQLENEWTLQLFERSRRSVSLTPAGKHMYDFWLRTHNDLITALKTAGRLNEQSVQHMRIGVFSHLDFWPDPNMLRQLRSQYPDTQFSVEFATEEDLMSRLWNGQLDVIITNRDAVNHQASMNYEELSCGNYIVSISRDFGLSALSDPDVDFARLIPELAATDLITLTDATISIRTLLAAISQIYDIQLRPRREAPSLEALHRMVESSMGFAFVDSASSNVSEHPRLFFADTGIPCSIGVVWLADSENEMIPVVIEALKAELAQGRDTVPEE